jgi:hypothetical protein
MMFRTRSSRPEAEQFSQSSSTTPITSWVTSTEMSWIRPALDFKSTCYTLVPDRLITDHDDGVIRSSETSFTQITRWYNQGDGNIHNYSCNGLKS